MKWGDGQAGFHRISSRVVQKLALLSLARCSIDDIII
jgi:hypothetical protein